MKNNILVILPLVSLLILINCSNPSEIESVASIKLNESLDKTFENILKKQKFVGLSATLILPDNSVWTGVNGVANASGELLTKDNLFGISSVTKTFISTLVLQLAEENLLNLDDVLEKWIPTYPNINEKVTIRQLLNMTSGIHSFDQNENWSYSMWNQSSRIWTPDEILKKFVNEAHSSPGTGWRYSNTNYILLGMIIEKASNTPVEKLLQERILEPLGLKNTFLKSNPKESLNNIAHPYADWNRNGHLQNIFQYLEPSYYSNEWTAWGMFSTTSDQARWITALTENSLIKQSSLDKMTDFVELKIPSPYNFQITGYGLGLIKIEYDNNVFWGHTGEGLGYHSLVFRSTKLDLTVALLINEWPKENLSWAFELYPVFEELVNSVISSKL